MSTMLVHPSGIVNSETVTAREAAQTIAVIKQKEEETVGEIKKYEESLKLNLKALIEKNKRLSQVLLLSKYVLVRKKKALENMREIKNIKATESHVEKRKEYEKDQ